MSGAEEAVRSAERQAACTGRRGCLLKGQFLALPVTDPLDGERVVCYRSFLARGQCAGVSESVSDEPVNK